MSASVPPTTQVSVPGDRIDLAIGQPDPALLPERLFRSLAADGASLAYGAEAGDGRFRRALSDWLGAQVGRPVPVEALLVTNGSSNALDMICTRFSRPGDVVLVEDPTYFIARRQLADHGLRAVPAAMDEEGLDVGALAGQIEALRPAFLYTIPSFHNPTGRTLGDGRRAALAALARASGCPVVADEVYQLLYYESPPPPPLACYDPAAPVLSVGSFSKILAPGLRLGWIQGGGGTLDRLLESGLLAGGGGLAPLVSALVRPLLEDGALDRHLERLRRAYRARLEALAAGLRRHLADRLHFTLPSGGYFVWGRWQGAADTAALLERARARGVGFLPGSRCSDAPGHASWLRLCFAFYAEPDLEEACRRLARLA